MTLRRLFSHLAASRRREAPPHIDDAVIEIDVTHSQCAGLSRAHPGVDQCRKIVAIRAFVDEVEHHRDLGCVQRSRPNALWPLGPGSASQADRIRDDDPRSSRPFQQTTEQCECVIPRR